MSKPKNKDGEIRAPIAIIGAGGIGSHFCALLDWAMDADQLDLERSHITVFDFDTVDESNLRHQDYFRNVVGFPKAFVMSSRYHFNGRCFKFGDRPSDFNDNNMFIVCADNPGVRMAVHAHCRATGKPFIDMRSEGDMYAVMTDACPEATYLASLGASDADRKDETGRSCQRAEDKAVKQVQLGHMAAAVAGMQILLKRFRKQPAPAQVIAAVA